MLNAFTVDVEDYFQVSAFEHLVPRNNWGQWESRIEASTHRILTLLGEFGVKGTFFILGWIAERFPRLVREIDALGHEIGSHSYWHRLIYTMTPDEFREDLRRSKCVLENLVKQPIALYRAPSFSITAKSRWALDILADEGFRIDSSVFPILHDRYGIPDAPRHPHMQYLQSGCITEFPPTTLAVGRFRLPISGGGYFRLYPFAMTRRAIEIVNRQCSPFMFYIHPWEVDPDQPRIPGVGWKSRFRHYVNLKRTELKLRRMLEGHQFGTVSESLKQQKELQASNSILFYSTSSDCSASAIQARTRHAKVANFQCLRTACDSR